MGEKKQKNKSKRNNMNLNKRQQRKAVISEIIMSHISAISFRDGSLLKSIVCDIEDFANDEIEELKLELLQRNEANQ